VTHLPVLNDSPPRVAPISQVGRSGWLHDSIEKRRVGLSKIGATDVKLYTLTEAGEKIGWHKTQVSRWVKRLGFGRRDGKTILLSTAEVRCLFWLRRATQAGNPNFRR